jgi:2,3-bisphosphoglycerate-dependent phosphoglycerate mutase
VTGRLVLLRHGESEWNAKNLFTGWVDVGLTDKGRAEAARGGELLRTVEDGRWLPTVAHTSLLTRAIRTSELALAEAGRSWVPVRRSWRLNERHYGDLQGKDKAETLAKYGEERFLVYRRSYSVPPPEIAADNPWDTGDDPRYAKLAADVRPRTECLADVVVRLLPYWYDAIVPDVLAGDTVLVAAHGNSLRALVMHLEGMSEDAVVALNIATGQPLVYDLDEALRPIGGKGRYLDPEAAEAAAAAVAAQGRKAPATKAAKKGAPAKKGAAAAPRKGSKGKR